MNKTTHTNYSLLHEDELIDPKDLINLLIDNIKYYKNPIISVEKLKYDDNRVLVMKEKEW